MGNTKTPITGFLIENADVGYVSFHMPGHKGAELYREFGYGEFLEKMMDCDITEVIGADNLFKAEGIIKEVRESYAKLYGVRDSYLLVNGTSGGLIAAILSAVPRGGRIIMARNSHKSIFNALRLGGIRPVYAYPEMIEEYGITGEVKADEIERLIKEYPDASAVILPSPNYYGICSDIEAIAKVVHDADKVLIVDQAHGAHLKFLRKVWPELPKPAEECGADIVVASTHKTLASFTQSAVLNVCSDRVSKMILEDRLQMIESSSPSYLLMASLDINAAILSEHGKELAKRWRENLEYAWNRLSQIDGLNIMKTPRLDMTKLNLDMSELGLDGGQLEEELLARGVRVELTTGNILMCMTGIGGTRSDYERLADALEDISKERKACSGGKSGGSAGTGDGHAASVVNSDDASIVNRRYDGKMLSYRSLELCDIPAESVAVKLKDAAGKICAASIIPYPPGIPIACPGERLTAELIAYIEGLIARGEKVIGVTSGEILVGAGAVLV